MRPFLFVSALVFITLLYVSVFWPNLTGLMEPWALEDPPYSWISWQHWLVVTTYFIIGLQLSYSSQQLIFLDSSTCTSNLEQRSKYMNIKWILVNELHITQVTKVSGFFFRFLLKVVHPKYYKHLKKAPQHNWADKKWADFWQNLILNFHPKEIKKWNK